MTHFEQSDATPFANLVLDKIDSAQFKARVIRAMLFLAFKLSVLEWRKSMPYQLTKGKSQSGYILADKDGNPIAVVIPVNSTAVPSLGNAMNVELVSAMVEVFNDTLAGKDVA